MKPDFGVRSRSGTLPARIGSMGPDLRVYRPAGVGTRRHQVPPVILMPWHPPQMAGGSAQGDGSGSTSRSRRSGWSSSSRRSRSTIARYEALQAFFVGRPDPRPDRREVQIDPVGDGQPQTPLRIRLNPCPQPPARKSALGGALRGGVSDTIVGARPRGLSSLAMPIPGVPRGGSSASPPRRRSGTLRSDGRSARDRGALADRGFGRQLRHGTR